jgi:hypothetical protein
MLEVCLYKLIVHTWAPAICCWPCDVKIVTCCGCWETTNCICWLFCWDISSNFCWLSLQIYPNQQIQNQRINSIVPNLHACFQSQLGSCKSHQRIAEFGAVVPVIGQLYNITTNRFYIRRRAALAKKSIRARRLVLSSLWRRQKRNREGEKLRALLSVATLHS